MNEHEQPELSASQTGDETAHDTTVGNPPGSTVMEPVDELEESLGDEEDFEDDFSDEEFDEEMFDEDDDEDSPVARARSLMEELFEDADFGEEMSDLDVLTLEEAADYLKVEYGAIRRLLKEQGLPGRKIGDEWRFLRGAIADWLCAPGGTAPVPTAPSRPARSEQVEQRPERQERREFTQRPRSQDRYSQDEQSGTRYPRQESRYPQQGGPPKRPRYTDANQSEGGQGTYPPPRRPRYTQDQNQQEHSQGEYRPPRRKQFGTGQGGYSNDQSGNRSQGNANYEGKRFQGGPKKPKRKALNEQRFKRLDRRKFGDGSGPAGGQDSDMGEE